MIAIAMITFGILIVSALPINIDGNIYKEVTGNPYHFGCLTSTVIIGSN